MAWVGTVPIGQDDLASGARRGGIARSGADPTDRPAITAHDRRPEVAGTRQRGAHRRSIATDLTKLGFATGADMDEQPVPIDPVVVQRCAAPDLGPGGRPVDGRT